MDLKIYSLIEELTVLWLKWMDNHNLSNDKKNSINYRRNAGKECELLQQRRQTIIHELNILFNQTL